MRKILFLGVILLLVATAFYITLHLIHPQSDTNLDDIVKRGELRILVPQELYVNGLPRAASITQVEIAAACAFAETLKVIPKIVYVEKFVDLLPALVNGKGDMAIGNITYTEKRAKQILFSDPISQTYKILIAGSTHPANSLEDFNAGTISVEWGTISERTAQKLAQGKPNIKVKVSTELVGNIINGVSIGDHELAICDHNAYLIQSTYTPEIKIIHSFKDNIENMCWAVNQNSHRLVQHMNQFIASNKKLFDTTLSTDDFDKIKNKKMIRMITRDNPSNYYMYAGGLRGFEYDMMKKFAEENGIQLVMIVPPRWRDMNDWLVYGRGDVIAASVTRPDTPAHPQLDFTIPYAFVNECVVSRCDSAPKSISDLKDRVFSVRPKSSYYNTILPLKEAGKTKIAPVPENVETYEILNGILNSTYDLTLIDDRVFNSSSGDKGKLESNIVLAKNKPYVWVVRRDNPILKDALNDFLTRTLNTSFHQNLCRHYFAEKFFEEAPNIPDFSLNAYPEINAIKKTTIISPFDPLFAYHCKGKGIDWLYIAAQAEVATNFNHRLLGSDGAMGLLQMSPYIAHKTKCTNPFDANENVRCSVDYLIQTKNRISKDVDGYNRLCFAFAAYQGGYGHLIDARGLARNLKLNPNVWKGNVEVAYQKLRENRYASRVRFGFCRADLVVNYVNTIMARRDKLKRLYLSEK